MEITNEDLATFADQALRAIGETQVADRLTIAWNPRMRTTAGRARLQTWTVELNPKLLPFGEQEVWQTVLHELAHLVAWRRYSHRGHGPAWKQACTDLGIPQEKVTHNLPLAPKRVQKKKWNYHCTNCDRSYPRVRRAKTEVACPQCCRNYNHGRFTRKFLLTEQQLP